MTKKRIKFNFVTDIGTFAQAATQCDFDIDLVSDRYVIDAKSIMGIFSLDISKAVDLVIHEEEAKAAKFLDAIKDMLV